MRDQKKYMRKLLGERRSKLQPDEVTEMSAGIISKLRSSKQFKKSKVILAYMSAKGEVFTTDFIRQCISEGKTICLPLALKNGGGLEIYKVEDLDSQLHLGSYGIYEPIADPSRKVDFHGIDLVLVPVVAFDVRKNRMGYGKGYYDRLIAQLKPSVLKVGLAYDFQVLSELPIENFDAKMDIIITEKRTIV